MKNKNQTVLKFFKKSAPIYCTLLCAFVIPLVLFSSCKKDSGSVSNTKDGTAQNVPAVQTINHNQTMVAKPANVDTPIVLNGKSNLIIRGDSINGGSQPCITLINCYNIRITNCKLVNSSTLGINISNSSMIHIDSNYISKVSTGVYALACTSIQVEYNQMQNMQGPYPKGAFVQFDNVKGSYNRVEFNILENISGASYPEDAISMYQSSGMSTDPIYIIGNKIRGGGPSKTGGGIMLGDGGGSYQVAEYNILVNPGQYGMAISGGTNMQILNNEIYSITEPFSNVGLYYWNQSGIPSSAVTISGNKVKFLSGLYGGENDYWLGAGSATPSGWSTNIWGANLSSSILPAVLITNK